MKKTLIALGIVSLLGIASFTVTANASDQGNETIKNESVNEDQGNNKYNFQGKQKGCRNLSEEQKSLMEKGYNELTKEEKETFDKYCTQSKRDLTEEQLNEYHKIQDKVHKYMDEDFKTKVNEKREHRQNNQKQGRGCGRRS